MVRLKVYSGGTGRLQLDSNESVVDEYSELATEDFQAGVLLYLDETNGALRCRFLARRRSPEQFVAFFKSEVDDDILNQFKRVLKDTLDQASWRIDRDDKWTNHIFDTFGETSPEEPKNPIVRRVIREYDRATLGVPTEHEALRLLEYCRRERDGSTLAVCVAERPEHLSETEVVVRPDEKYGSVVPVGQTANRVRREQGEDAFKELTSALSALAEALDEEVEEPHRRRQLMVISLRRAGVEGDSWTVVTESDTRGTLPVVEYVRSVLSDDVGAVDEEGTVPEDAVDESVVESVSTAAEELRAWTNAREFQRAIGEILKSYEVKIKSE
jgi:hypothetical protein